MDDGTDPHPATGPPPPSLGLRTDDGEPRRESPVSPYAETQSRRRTGTRSTASSSSSPATHPPRFLLRTDDGHIVGPLSAQEVFSWGAEQPRRGSRRSMVRSVPRVSSSADPHPPASPVSQYAGTQGHRRPGTRSTASSSSSATRSDRLGAEGRARVRQSILYSDRPRHSRPRRLAQAEEHIALSSSELCGLNMTLPTSEALSSSDPQLSIPESAEEICDDNDGAEEHPGVVSSSELGRAVADLPTFEALSLSDPPLLTPQTETGDETDDDDDGLPSAGQTVLFHRSVGVSRSMIESLADSLFITVPNNEEQRPKPYSNVDPEELRIEMKEYLDVCPIFPSVASDRIAAIEDANLNAHAAELGTEAPGFPTEEASVAAERKEDSTTWMNKEVMLCFKKLVEISPDLMELEDYHFDELLHQCFNMESYNKVYHHYNFTVRMKMPNAADWTVGLYFAEVKEVFRTKYYLCYPLDPNENGQCYACENQGVVDLRHPAIDLFEMGSPDASSSYRLWYTDD